MNADEIMKLAWEAAPSWTSEAERGELIRLAGAVRDNGVIVEIGGLYGGMTAVLGLANPRARITVIDEFSWDPYNRGASAKHLLENVRKVGVESVEVITGDSRKVWKQWKKQIDFLWIDGGHSYEFVKSDLDHFGPRAKLIALHDWENPAWASVKQAVLDWLGEHPEWKFDHHVEMVAVLTPLSPSTVTFPQMSAEVRGNLGGEE